jgi:hypothetical protein
MTATYIAHAEVSPSEQAIKILGSYHSNTEKLLLLANSGSHVLNKYHNVLHELQNVYYAWSCYMNESGPDRTGPIISALLYASLFHDHNHSGGILSDEYNVARAVEFAQRELNLKDGILDIIRCTQFVDGKFPIEPTNLAERCIRDADLMTVYSYEGHQLTVGLFEEILRKPFSLFTDNEIQECLSRNENFLFAQTMYTDHGNRMRDTHLIRQLENLQDYVWELRNSHRFGLEKDE